MNRSNLSLLMAVTACGVFLGGGLRLNSQEAAALPKTPVQQLRLLKASNADLLVRQQQTLQRLDEIKLQADQLRIMSSRN